jgi:thiamine biosynthesis protein ThiI
MMAKRILIRFGDMMLKGQNIGFFIKRIRMHIKHKLSDLDVSFLLRHDRIMIDYHESDEQAIIDRLKDIQGIHDFSVAYLCEPHLDDITKTAIMVLDQEIQKDGTTLKIETRRTNKAFPMTSIAITQTVAKPIIEGIKWHVKVDVNHPDETLHIDLRLEAAYIYLKSIKGMGGYPYGTGGKALLMMSGGLDSPVCAYLAMKQGLDVELIHFESSPLTPLESVQKVIDLSIKLARYTFDDMITLHVVPFKHIHEQILSSIFEPYMITIMRRMMYRISERWAIKKSMHALISGDSVGQVASQTLPSLRVVESVTKLPVLRPVITYDKLEIIQLAKQIETYDISIRPFQDCCSLYLPKQPVTKPMNIYCEKYESAIDFEPMLTQAIQSIMTLRLHKDDRITLASYGLDALEALTTYRLEKSESIDHLQTKQDI